MFLVNLNKEERKRVYNVFSLNDFRKYVHHTNPDQRIYLKAFKKTADRITKAELEDYVENYYASDTDPIIKDYCNALSSVIGSKYKSAKTVADIALESELSEEDLNEKLEPYREEFEACDFRFSYEEFINLFKKPTQETFLNAKIAELQEELTVIQEKLTQQLNKAQEKEDKWKEEEKGFKETINALQQEKKKLQNELDITKKQYSASSVQVSLSNALGFDIKGKTYEEIYETLKIKEEDCLFTGKIDELKRILAAKYAVITSMKGEINNEK